MGSDHEAEIRASVGAHHDLGPDYDDAVAEGLVERIGAEIDKRVEAQLRRYGVPVQPPVPAVPPLSAVPPVPPVPAVPPGGVPQAPASPGPPQGYPAPAGYPGYPGYPGYQAPMLPPAYPVPAAGTRSASRSAGQRSVAMTVIALGSMALGVAATAIVAHARSDGGQAVMVLLIWAVIAIVNIAYARRC
jgi:hypothetical protein